MIKEVSEKKINEEVYSTIESIKIIEKHIEDFKRRKPLFFQKRKLVEYNNRIDKLEDRKRCLCSRLEYKLDNNIE